MHSGRVKADTLGVLEQQSPDSMDSSALGPSDSSEQNDDMYAVSQKTDFPEPYISDMCASTEFPEP